MDFYVYSRRCKYTIRVGVILQARLNNNNIIITENAYSLAKMLLIIICQYIFFQQKLLR